MTNRLRAAERECAVCVVLRVVCLTERKGTRLCKEPAFSVKDVEEGDPSVAVSLSPGIAALDSVPAVRVAADAARRFLVARHLLAPARSLKRGPDAVLGVFCQLGSIQFDPLAVAGRNHDLVLHARVADYDTVWCEELLYGRGELFEAHNKGLSLLLTREPWPR